MRVTRDNQRDSRERIRVSLQPTAPNSTGQDKTGSPSSPSQVQINPPPPPSRASAREAGPRGGGGIFK